MGNNVANNPGVNGNSSILFFEGTAEERAESAASVARILTMHGYEVNINVTTIADESGQVRPEFSKVWALHYRHPALRFSAPPVTADGDAGDVGDDGN